ncbi:MAG: DUF1295 domain-containing protein [Chitinophagales bacterium]
MNYSFWQAVGWIWVALAVVTFLALFFLKITPPYGRHTKTTWGPMINNSLGWMIMEAPSVIILWCTFTFFYSHDTPQIAYLPMILWSLHYFNRSFIFPFRLKNKQQKMPLVITGSSIFFNAINGFLNGLFLAMGWFYVSIPLIIIGVILFFIGMYINMRSDNILIALRQPGEKDYKIPKGFLFEKITAPNLFGEIVEWLGFFILAPSVATFSFWLWTMANLIPRARDHHQWYLNKFEEYPKERKVVIPGIY